MNNINQCSEEFSEAFSSHMGTCRATCHCGREWFDNVNRGYSWDVGEYERLEERAAKEPDKCIPAGGSISSMIIDGKEIIWGCRCDTAKKYESFLLRHQTQIADYLRRRAVRLKAEAESIKVEAESIDVERS